MATVAALAGFVTLWAVYGFTFGPMRTYETRLAGRAAEGAWPVPFPVFWETLLSQATYGAQGKTSYLFGEARREGWWWFYLAVAAFKTTVGAQLLFAWRLLDSARARAARLADLALLAGPAILFVALSLGQAQGGVRYLLPAFPCVFAYIARGLAEKGRARSRAGVLAFTALLGLGAAESLRVYPHSLMFFNLWAGGPKGGPRYLIYSDDWGQDKKRLARWQRDNGVRIVAYTPYGGHPKLWGIRWDDVSCTPRKGVYALHAEEVHRHGIVRKGCLDWLTLEPPDERLGYSIYLYVVDERRLRRLAEACATKAPFWRSGASSPCPRFEAREAGRQAPFDPPPRDEESWRGTEPEGGA
jgi:hypothetical protein